jgi:beta-fructofuranosidase
MPSRTVDPHLPKVHLRPPKNWINDPNGLVFHHGWYHVFFQHNPDSTEHGNIHWGHYRSRDLINWELLPDALAPTPGGDDADGCYSGNGIADGDRIVVFYSANRADRWWQSITSAESRDDGHTWTKRPQPLISRPPADTTMFRDPYVWLHHDRWRLLVGAALADGRGAALLYESPDLQNWTPHGPWHTSEAGDTIGWECPQYATFADHGLLLISQWHPQRGPQRVLAYTRHEQRGWAAAPVLLDHGPDFYAPALLHAPDGRWLLWGWTPEARSTDWVQQAGWSGALTLPREVSLNDDGTVHQKPAREVLNLRARQALHHTAQLATGLLDFGPVSRTFDLTAILTADGSHGPGLRLITSPDGTEHLDIRWNPLGRQVTVDRTNAARDPRAHGGVHTITYADIGQQSLELRIIIDGSIAELYLAGGQTLTLRFYPTGPGPWRLQALGPATGTAHITVQLWDLRNDTHADTDL